MTKSNPVDVLVIGAGLAGLGLSLRVAQTGLRVTLGLRNALFWHRDVGQEQAARTLCWDDIMLD